MKKKINTNNGPCSAKKRIHQELGLAQNKSNRIKSGSIEKWAWPKIVAHIL